jgi:Tfp pilus assembly pilus retraction ATPase PilT
MSTVDYKRELGALVDLIIQEEASDLHLSFGAHPLIRVSGTLIPLVKKPILNATDLDGFAKILMRDDQYEKFVQFN